MRCLVRARHSSDGLRSRGLSSVRPIRGVLIASRLIVALVLAASATACNSESGPDLSRLYASGMEEARTAPVILIPGALGSRLYDRQTRREVWPGSVLHLLVGSKQDLVLPFDPLTLQPVDNGLEASGLFEEVLNADFYGAILRTLRQAGGFVPGVLGTPADPRVRRYYVFAYDWRQDNVTTAQRLDALIEQIRRDYGDPALKVNVIAHSMGGLLTRYYLRYGTVDALQGDGDFPINMRGAEKIGTVVLLGTPNLGSVNALQSLLLGHKVGLRRIEPEVLATMPSVFELLPHPLTDWSVDPGGRDLNLDLYDVATWKHMQWSVFDPAVIGRVTAGFKGPGGADAYMRALQAYFARNLERARRFIWSVTFEEPSSPVKFVVFGGDCVLTPARIVIEPQAGRSLARLFPQDVQRKVPGVDYGRLMLEPGDGEVTKPSLLAREALNPVAPRNEALFFPLAYAFFLCENHERLTGNINFQDNLLNVLLARERPWDTARASP
jgi:pimeloyl-ACP methyl ester carboxylesterase